MKIKLDKSNKYLSDIKCLYETAFPENERCEFNYLLNGRHPNYELFAIIIEDTFVGFIFVAFYKEIAYINYFAIKEEFRNCGYGSMALSLLKEKLQEYNILLSIEKPVSKMQKRRLKFYQRNDFFTTGFELKCENIEFQVLCYGNYNYELLFEFFKIHFPNAEYL